MSGRIKLMFDSGAYTAWRKYTNLDVNKYIPYVKANEPFIDCYFNLDIIPGSPARRGRPEEIEQAAEQSYRNQQLMKAAGLHPIPVFHPGERFYWLKRYLADGEPIIALSIKGSPYPAMPWLTDCFKIISKYPSVKVHGLGTNSVPILHKFPFTSVDASTWLKQPSNAQIPVPRYTNGKANYALPHQPVNVSPRSFEKGIYIEHLPKFVVDRTHRFLDEVGITLEQARDKPHNRQRVWLTYLRGLQASCGTQIVPVSALGKSYKRLLLEYGFEQHLLSYYQLRKAPKGALEKYVTGPVVDN